MTTLSSEVPNNCKITDDQNFPVKELLGSVTTYNNAECSDIRNLQLRTSARVFKKMKLDLANVTTIVSDKKESNKGEIKSDIKRSFRPLWSQEDKNLFFEALNEYGKDFEAIHSYISSKLKKKGFSDFMIKTKDQVRHLYYRTWHKISKYLRFSDDVKKIAQELYALINYGELRKKLAFISEKTCIKLNELMYRGSVAIRVKGKTIRIKTPMCRALRKLNLLDEKYDDLKLPTRVTVELHPKNMNTWMRVQNMSQNPRVKATLPLQKRLSTLILCMEERWKSRSVVEQYEILNYMKVLSNEKIVSDSEEDKSIVDAPLRLCPTNIQNMELPEVNLSDFLTSQSICLNSYEERNGVNITGERLWLKSYPNSNKGSTKKSGIKRIRTEDNSEKLSLTHSNNLVLSSGADVNEDCLNDSDIGSAVNCVVDEAVNTILALQNQEGNSSGDEKPAELNAIKVDVDEIKCDTKKEQDLLRFQNGWTIRNCGALSIGDLYLMFGEDSKLVLEYSWDHIKIEKLETETMKLEESVTKISGSTKEEVEISENKVKLNLCNTPESLCDSSNNLSVALKTLLSVSKLHYKKNRVCCPCGHICDSPSKVNRNACTNLKLYSRDKFYNTKEKSVLIGQHLDGNTPNFRPFVLEPRIRRLSPSVFFRRPSSPNDILRAQLDSIQRLKPRYSNRKGNRPRAKQLVVERKLPVLANKTENGRQLVQMNIISQDNISVSKPITSETVNQYPVENIGDTKVECSLNTPSTVVESVVSETPAGANIFTNIQVERLVEKNTKSNVTQSLSISDNATTPSRTGSPTNSIPNLIEMAVIPRKNNAELTNTQSVTKEDITSDSFEGLLSQNMSVGTSSPSPSRILKENENQWLTDFSLSSFLGRLDSPTKHTQSSTNVGDDTRLSLTQDVDAHVQSLLTESSLDYTAKFADLAAQVTDIKK